MKYYYTDPLKAAWMFREFGFIYEHLCDESLAVWTRISDFHSRQREFVVMPFCYDALKPQVGDVIICDHMGEVKEIYEIREDWCSFLQDGGGCNFAGIREIIRRKDVAFFAPEVDNG